LDTLVGVDDKQGGGKPAHRAYGAMCVIDFAGIIMDR